jgi:hypothetical protein
VKLKLFSRNLCCLAIVTEKALKRKILPSPPKKKKRKRKSKQSVCWGLSAYVIKMSLWIRRRTQKVWTTELKSLKSTVVNFV